ncbi:hypothetical protein JCM19046_3535 [Bacillus sp. JCM 19046]|nr:hypothetical protein JCM19045_4239 [Bacillus sp. JCM 19045]GAF18923.1 hypothetical protein JCM19046_3535 [Bacillus sp. JCM 19046]
MGAAQNFVDHTSEIVEENKALMYMGHKYFSGERLYIINEDLEHGWTLNQLNGIRDQWNDGESLRDIAEHYDADPDSIVLVLIHLGRRGKLKQRPGGLFA